MDYDVVIAGGSIAGLICAREIAEKGYHVLVVEEDYEIGTPEHFGGLVSVTGLQELGVVPHRKTYEHRIDTAEIFSPNGKSFVINSTKQNVVEINRRELDKQIARQAQQNGAEIRVKTSFQGITDDGVKLSDGNVRCKVIVDARGVAALINRERDGILSSAQHEVYADWIKKGKVEVYFDQEKYPGFFAWIIPSSDGTGKVGVAGRAINVSSAIEDFLSKKGKYSIIRKIFAPIWIKGPIDEFVSDNIVTIGDAAGQSKPTTAGGIYSCGIGGLFAGRAIVKFLETGNNEELKEYQKKWKKKFGKEFDKQLLARRLLEKLDNESVNKLFNSVTPEIINEISEGDDFDFHTSSIIKLLGIKRSFGVAQTILGEQIKRLLTQ